MLALIALMLAAPPDRPALLKKMEQAMGPLPAADRIVPADVRILSEEKLDGYTRIKLTFAPETGDRVPAWLLVPTGFAGKRPAALCLHQTNNIGKDEPVGRGGRESLRQALDLVKRGYVCLAPDYPSFGEYPYDFKAAFAAGKYQSGVMKAVWNNMRAVDVLRSRPEVDGDRIAAIGHSLGGHTALFTAAWDERIKAAVTSCGFNGFAHYYGGNLKGWTSDRYMPRIASEYGSDPKRVPFDFDDVLLAICPRAVFVMAPERDANFAVVGVREVLDKVRPVYVRQGAAEKLVAVHPDAEHDWPAAEREAAYRFLDRALKP